MAIGFSPDKKLEMFFYSPTFIENIPHIVCTKDSHVQMITGHMHDTHHFMCYGHKMHTSCLLVTQQCSSLYARFDWLYWNKVFIYKDNIFMELLQK